MGRSVESYKYKKHLWEYKKRRSTYKKHVRELSKKIKLWAARIRRIEKTNDKLKKIEKEVNRYFSVNISSKKMDATHKLARNIYYKIAVESKIEGKRVSEFIGRNKKAAGYGRMSFTKSFYKMPENKKAFHSFKNFFESK